MDFKETYLQKAWSDSLEDVSLEDVRDAIKEVQEIDGEHAAFWVGIVDEDEFILEVNKDLSLMAILDRESEEEIHSKAKDWEDVENSFKLFLNEQFDELKKKLK
jgi:uncharacterized radical SAM superfamily protein